MSNTDALNRKLETNFATVEIDDGGIIHVKGKEGADVTRKDFEILDNWLAKFNLEKLIIFADRSQSYSHTFDAQKFLMNKEGITALAMYVTTPISEELALLSKDVYMKNFSVKVFTDKKEALTWLKTFL
jgi:tmRNA-binding protein